jgi:SGNH domain (fused to AT3 domains)
MLTPGTPYPGVAALLPVVSAGAMIWANGASATTSGKVLSLRWLTTVGALSYSLYLWHWPVLTLARDYTGRELNATETLGALLAVAVLSYVSWRWVERPFRLGGDPAAARRPLTGFVVIGAAVLATAGLTVARQGFPARLSETALAFDSAGQAETAGASRCHRGPPDPGTLCMLVTSTGARAHLLVWGDSHANAIVPALTELGKRYAVAVTQASYSSCPPLLDVRVAHVPGTQYCSDFNTSALRAVQELGVTRVLLAAYWSVYLPPHPEPALDRLLDPYRDSGYLAGGSAADNARNFSNAVQRTVRALRHLGVEVWILRQVPDQHDFVPLALSRAAARGLDYEHMGTTLTQYRQNQALIDTTFETLGTAVHLIDPATPLCGGGVCRSSVGGHSLYIDANHLSASGALRLEPALEPLFH